jgi:Spy/CpxP family protein refolding chaperone
MPRPRDPFPWWKDSQLAAELKLTGDQTRRLEKSFLDFRLQLIDLRAELERQEARFGVLVDADDLDLAAATKQAAEVARSRAELERTTTVMLLSLRRELSVEQWQTLQRHEERNRPRTPMPPPVPAPY